MAVHVHVQPLLRLLRVHVHMQAVPGCRCRMAVYDDRWFAGKMEPRCYTFLHVLIGCHAVRPAVTGFAVISGICIVGASVAVARLLLFARLQERSCASVACHLLCSLVAAALHVGLLLLVSAADAASCYRLPALHIRLPAPWAGCATCMQWMPAKAAQVRTAS